MFTDTDRYCTFSVLKSKVPVLTHAFNQEFLSRESTKQHWLRCFFFLFFFFWPADWNQTFTKLELSTTSYRTSENEFCTWLMCWIPSVKITGSYIERYTIIFKFIVPKCSLFNSFHSFIDSFSFYSVLSFAFHFI